MTFGYYIYMPNQIHHASRIWKHRCDSFATANLSTQAKPNHSIQPAKQICARSLLAERYCWDGFACR